jgi:hypothetical protein
MIAISQMGHWVTLMVTTLAKHGGDFLGEPRRRLLFAFPFVALLHPGLWLTPLVFVAPWLALNTDQSGPIRMAAAGFCLWLFPFAGLIVKVLLRMRKQQDVATRI